MSFLEKIPQHIKDVEAEIKRLGVERVNIDWGDEGHECDCEFCDRRGAGAKPGDPEAEHKADLIDAAVKDCRRLIDSMKRYSNNMGVEIEDAAAD